MSKILPYTLALITLIFTLQSHSAKSEEIDNWFIETCFATDFCPKVFIDGARHDQLIFESGLAFKGQALNPFTGVTTYYDNSKLDKKFYFSEGIKVAIKKFDEAGNIRAEGRYKNNKASGEWVYYWDKTVEKGNFLAGVPVGIWRHFEDGEITLSMKWTPIKNTPDTYEAYDLDGVLDQTAIFKEGLPHGVANHFHVNGKKAAILHFDEGVFHGNYLSWHENGNPKIVGFYRNGKLHGEYKTYYDNGNLEWRANFSDGVLDGMFESFREDGTPIYKANSLGGFLHGERVEFDEKGTEIKRTQYEAGEEISVQKPKEKTTE